MIHLIQGGSKKLSKSLGQGFKKFLVMWEYQQLFGMGFGLYSVSIFTIRFRVMGIMENPILKAIMILWWVIVVFVVLMQSYSKYYLMSNDIQATNVFDAFRKSISLSISNFGLTIKGVLFEMLLMVRFIINAFIIIAIPL